MYKLSAIAVAALAASAHGHMRLFYPPDFGAEENPHRTSPADKTLDYPYDCCGQELPFPCRGYLDRLGTDEGQTVATWEAGSTQNFSLIGQGTHWGGSCQAGFSTDKGETWKVIKSWEGACPKRSVDPYNPDEHTYEVTVPEDTPAGDHVFAWTWFNREQEFFMSCSPIKVTGGTKQRRRLDQISRFASGDEDDEDCVNPTKRTDTSAPVAFKDRPGFLFANVESAGYGCKTPKTTAEVKYPDPGPDVVEGDGEYPLEVPCCDA